MEKLKTFVAIVESGSFNRASKRLYNSPQALMKQITSLENEVGSELLTRTSQGVRLTERGKLFYDAAKSILETYGNVVDEMGNMRLGEGGVIRVGATASGAIGLIADLFAGFREDHPNVRIAFPVLSTERNHNQLLLSGELDICEEFLLPVNEDDRIGTLHTFDIETCCYLSRHNPLASKERISASDLTGCDVYVWSHETLPRIASSFENSGIPLRTIESGPYATSSREYHRISTDQMALRIITICENGGVVVHPDNFHSAVSSLAAVPLEDGPVWETAIAFNKQAGYPTSEFVRYAAERLNVNAS